jgi:hypothetical protein
MFGNGPATYPTDLPISEIKNVIATLRSGSVPDKKVLSKDIWLLAGYLLNRVIGEPVPNGVVGASLAGVTLPSTHDVLTALDNLVNSTAGDAALDLLPISVHQIIKWTFDILVELF